MGEAVFRAFLLMPHFLWVLPLKWTAKQQQLLRIKKKSLSSIIQSCSCLSERQISWCICRAHFSSISVWFCLCSWQSILLPVIRECCRFFHFQSQSVCVCPMFWLIHHMFWAIYPKAFNKNLKEPLHHLKIFFFHSRENLRQYNELVLSLNEL